MEYYKIVELINKKIPSEQLNYDRLSSFMDEVIDDINAQLGANFPTFSDVESNRFAEETANEWVYDYFPDRYIRTVVVTGAAAKWYTADEEGIETATTYIRDYDRALFIMLRDFSYEFMVDAKYNEWRQAHASGAIPDYAPASGITYYNPLTGRKTGINKHIIIHVDELTGDDNR